MNEEHLTSNLEFGISLEGIVRVRWEDEYHSNCCLTNMKLESVTAYQGGKEARYQCDLQRSQSEKILLLLGMSGYKYITV